MSKQLAKCPFCGGEAEFYRTTIKTNGGWCDGVVVRCKVCEARTNRVLYDAKKHSNDEEYEEAAKAWNTRKPMQKIVERLEKKHEESTNNYHNLHDVSCLGESHAYRNAIEIVKEEGESNE